MRDTTPASAATVLRGTRRSPARHRPWRALVVGWLLGACASVGAQQGPLIEKATRGERCVEDTATMRRNHMRMLEHQRDETVHGGIRGARHSLKGCVECHASPKTGSVASAPTDFCRSCHVYAAVKLDCFECHASRPGGATVPARSSMAHILASMPPTAPAEVLRK